MSDRQIGIPENRALGVSAALHNSVVQEYTDRVKELESALASERAKTAAAETDLSRVIGARNRYEVALNVAEATIAQVRELERYALPQSFGDSIPCILARDLDPILGSPTSQAEIEWTREKLARIIWETSRADEGTISATGANIVADAILAAAPTAAFDAALAEARAGALEEVAEWYVEHGGYGDIAMDLQHRANEIREAQK